MSMQRDTIAAYIRLSVEDGDLDGDSRQESNSIVHQRMLIHEFIQSRPEFQNCRIQEFCDDGYTGTNFDRPGFQEMMAMVKAKGIGCIIVKDLSRFGREYLEVSSYLERILPVFDIRFISINDYFDSDAYAGTTGGMELAFRNLINSMYSRDISMKVRTARKTRERRGEYLGGHPFYGYLKDPADRHHLIVDEEARMVIEDIFHMSVQGLSTTEIARRLNERQIPCPVEHKRARGIGYSKKLAEGKGVWIQSTVRKIIRDERYTGKMVSNVRSCSFVGKTVMVNHKPSDWIVVADTHEPVISEELFQEANAALASRVRVANRNTSWKASGNLFVCGSCGRKLQRSKGKEPYLYCPKSRFATDQECCEIHEDIRKVQHCVLEALRKMEQAMWDETAVRPENTRGEVKQLEREAEYLMTRIQKYKLEKRRLYEAYKSGQMTKDEFIQAQEQHRQTVQKLEQEAGQKAKEAEEKKKDQEAAMQVRAELRTTALLTEYDAGIIGQIVERVTVYGGGRIELVMKNRDSYERVFQGETELSA